MNTLVRSILAGLLLGVALFLLPFFLLRLALFFLLIGGLFRLIRGNRFNGGRRWGRGFGPMPAFADHIRQMSDEEYNQFKQRYAGTCRPFGTPATNPTSENQ